MAAGDTVTLDYEEYEPLCHWKREQECDTLEVHLQGFKKDQMKVQVSNAGVMVISGKRPLDETKTKWSHFRKEIVLPKNYKNDEIRAKLSSGVLHLTMPKKSSSTTTSNVQEQSKMPSENQENERNKPKTTLDTIANNIKDKELSNRKNIMSSENSKQSSHGGFRVRDLITNKMGRNVALAIALASILGAFVIYKYRQPSYVNDN